MRLHTQVPWPRVPCNNCAPPQCLHYHAPNQLAHLSIFDRYVRLRDCLEDGTIGVKARRVYQQSDYKSENIDTADNEQLLELSGLEGLEDGIPGGNGEEEQEDEEEDGIGSAVPDPEERWDTDMHISIKDYMARRSSIARPGALSNRRGLHMGRRGGVSRRHCQDPITCLVLAGVLSSRGPREKNCSSTSIMLRVSSGVAWLCRHVENTTVLLLSHTH